jgi:hypothetical protein
MLSKPGNHLFFSVVGKRTKEAQAWCGKEIPALRHRANCDFTSSTGLRRPSEHREVDRFVFPPLLPRPGLTTFSVASNLSDKEGHLYPCWLHSSATFSKPIGFGSWMTPDLKACDFSWRLSRLCWWTQGQEEPWLL